jgi:SAM-dependent methyltransferase
MRENVADRIFEVTDKQDDPILPRYYFKCPACETYSAPNIYFPTDKYTSVPLEFITITELKTAINRARVARLTASSYGLPDDAVLYDLGSGEGAFTHAFTEHFPRATAFACEADDRLKDKFYRDNVRIHFVNQFIEDFLDEQIETSRYPGADLVVLTDVLEHVVEPESLLSRVCRVMSDHGLAYIVVPNASTLGPGTWRSNNEVDWAHANRTCQHIWMYEHREFMELVQQSFEVLDTDETFETDLRRDSIYTTVVARRR